ncbi:MAG: bi-domain-containing oxidoreductase [Thermodesulfobacteriota bacterium]
MKQLTQRLKDGAMNCHEVPLPTINADMVLVKNHFSLISAGTESSTVRAARKSLLGKAKERPQQVKQVLDTLLTQGPVQTYRAVMKKLEAYSPLGYSCAGEVIGLAPDVNALQKGELVACGGLTACHAEVVAVPVNLCVKLDPDADMKQAAYNSLGAIALQGVRQADLRLGETCAVIGLGLLGQLTVILLRAAGNRVIGLDLDTDLVDIAGRHGADLALNRSDPGLLEKSVQFTGGLGCDAVIITAATDSLDPINLAGAMARKKGSIVVVGAVPTGFDREPHFYRKELQVRMSCSYGPGRYDPLYEDKGLDYPAAYVRWTEQRNMQAFQEMIKSRRIDVSHLTTHVFKLDQAPAAYDLMLSRSEPFIGILIEYDRDKPIESRGRVELRPTSRRPAKVSIGFIGAGSYAQSHLLPNLPESDDVRLKGVMTATSAGARSAGERFGFEFCTGQAEEIINNPEINTVFIATRHDSHARYVLETLKAGRNVFVEKPPCLNQAELEEIKTIYEANLQDRGEAAPILMVGYNRRFSPLMEEIKKNLGQGPLAAVYRINSGAIPPDSWIQDPELGGGRIIGEVGHFVDTLIFLTGSRPISLFAAGLPDPHGHNDIVQTCLKFADGSVATIAYLANGDRSLPKERLEVFGHGVTAVLDDYKTLTWHARGKKKSHNLLSQDKGQKNEVRAFLDAVRNGTGEVIPFQDIYLTSLVTFKILESLRTSRSLVLDEPAEPR